MKPKKKKNTDGVFLSESPVFDTKTYEFDADNAFLKQLLGTKSVEHELSDNGRVFNLVSKLL